MITTPVRKNGRRRTVIENRCCGPKVGGWQPYDRGPRLGSAVAQSALEQELASRVMELAT